jgi:3-hydroxyisobutyrate dehydrogenase
MPAALAIGFIGIGNMGWPMAANLVKAGYPVTVYDTDPARVGRFVAEHGAHGATDLESLGRIADVVITMLPNGRLVRAVVTGGLLAGLRRGAVVVDMSSSDPSGTRALGEELGAAGVTLVDAPVSGLVDRARTGSLTIMIGADDEAAVRTVQPVLECLGERLFRTGGLGCGHAMKALNNVVAATAFTVTAEALIIGCRFGLDPKIMTDILNVSTGRSFHSDVSFPGHVLTRRFATGFTLGLLAKDVGIAADLGASLDAATPVVQLVRQLWAEGCADIGADEDNSAIVRRWERLNQVNLATGEGDAGPADMDGGGSGRSGSGKP